MERFAQLAAQALNTVLESPIQAPDLETPPDPNLGDFGFPCFKLAKQFRKGPPQVAQQLVAALQSQGSVPKELHVAAVGPYVNFTIAREALLTGLLRDILKTNPKDPLGDYGKLPESSRGSWVLEYSSPNIAKPMNIYHLRPTALGAALDRVGRMRGYQVTSVNHLGDWGKQYGMLTVAFRLYGHELKHEPTMTDLVQLYVRINADAEKNPTLEDEARAAFLKLEQGDPETTALWKKCVEISLKDFNRMYARLNVRFDHIWGESFYQNEIPKLIALLRSKSLLVESEGALVVPLGTDNPDPSNEVPPCIIQKKDGATIYATRDLAAAIYRHEKFHFDRMTYIVGQEQKLHFQQVFEVLRKIGFSWAAACEHIPFGLYRFKDAKMSTRKGNFVTLEEVLAMTRDRVTQLMTERANAQASTQASTQASGQGTGAAPDEAIVEAVAIGAVVFHDLHTDPVRDVEFDLDRVVDFEGETGPYLQYAHTRCLSILRKARESGQGSDQPEFSEKLISHLKTPEEILLVKTLGQLPLHLERTLAFAKASQLAHYLIDVTQAFGAFYRECHVLGEAPELTQARLMLVEATRRILGRGLALLGIPTPERM